MCMRNHTTNYNGQLWRTPSGHMRLTGALTLVHGTCLWSVVFYDATAVAFFVAIFVVHTHVGQSHDLRAVIAHAQPERDEARALISDLLNFKNKRSRLMRHGAFLSARIRVHPYNRRYCRSALAPTISPDQYHKWSKVTSRTMGPASCRLYSISG